ncbi:nucleotidyltransferase [Candidatus Acetothermia bacterium]|nr:nucleotidyltransferase [Candidatus Acetothermia bacterium]MCI2427637.1 nucleotidyltransferase [Candidatus Acetothermia bacterium]MCI2428486.1 nucleotidyltransferase [Candidatus Acetothermia bacterium]
MSPKLTLIVMAAGIGSRYGGLKQIDPIGPHNELIIDYSIYDALAAGFTRVVFVINETIEQLFRQRVGEAIEDHCETAYVLQRIDNLPVGFTVPPARTRPWGTAHAILSCKDIVDSPFAVINADDFYGRASFHILIDYLKKLRDNNDLIECCMVGYELEKTLSNHGHVTRGLCTVDQTDFLVKIDERSRIQKFGEVIKYSEDGIHWTEIGPETIVSMNMWGFVPSLFSELETRFPSFLREKQDEIEQAEFLLPSVIGSILNEQRARVKVLPTCEQWFGVTYQQDRAQARDAIALLIQQGLYPKKLWGNKS